MGIICTRVELNMYQNFDGLWALRENALGSRHRLLLHAVINHSEGADIVEAISAYFEKKLIIDAQFTSPIKQIRPLLGSEFDLVAINATIFFEPNLLAMVTPMVKAGGAFLLLTPSFEQWPSTQLQTTHDYPLIRFIRYTIKHLEKSSVDWIAVHKQGIGVNHKPVIPNPLDLSEQKNAIKAIEKVMTGRARRPLVIEADRGRGKSAALGIAAARLIKSRPHIRIGICAPSLQSAKTLLHHLTAEIHHGNQWQFIPIDELMTSWPELDLLLIDEAATFPVYCLTEIIQHYVRIVFATTINGYEGSGNGFYIRFFKTLVTEFPQTKHLKLKNPIRFAYNDPLAQFTLQTLQLNAQLNIFQEAHKTVSMSWVNQSELLVNENLLSSVIALLKLAHYQTTPNDLSLLLDHPAIHIARLSVGQNLIAVALIIEEGNLSAAQQQELLQARRRFQGNLLPQLLFAQGLKGALEGKFWRIMRIAVRPEKQNQQWGSQLLNFIRYHAELNAVTWLGANFSLEPKVLTFWQKNQYYPVHLGSKKSKSTGLFSVTCIKPLSQQLEASYKDWRNHFSLILPTQLLMSAAGIPVSAVQSLFAELNCAITHTDKWLAERFVNAQSSYETAQVALFRVLCFYLSYQSKDNVPSWIIEKIILNQSFSSVVKHNHLTGRKIADKLLREFFQVTLSYIGVSNGQCFYTDNQ